MPLFLDVKKALFHGFEIEASYHEELATTFQLTSSPAWADWLKMEQKYVPSRFTKETTIVQAECDAPDAATCLQWVAQARKDTPQVVSTYILWARGMTAQSAIASILFQMVQQRPSVLPERGLTLKSFVSANSSLPKLWSLFLHMVKALGGLMVYISIGSVGEEEYSLVEKFVDLCAKWQSPPINVIMIHPFDDNFVKVDDCVDLDEKYDVHPSLTTTDALYHVVLMKLRVREMSPTVQIVLWEALWREVRYAVIGIAVIQALAEIRGTAETLAKERGLDEQVAGLWEAGVESWTKNKKTINVVREQIQRHLDVVDLHLPDDVRVILDKKVEEVIDKHIEEWEMGDIIDVLKGGDSKPLSDAQRDVIWRDIQESIRPGTRLMYSHSIKALMDSILTNYLEDPAENPRAALARIQSVSREAFGWHGKWKRSFSEDKDLVVDGIVASINAGLPTVVEAVKEMALPVT
jgi:hypothetical protein